LIFRFEIDEGLAAFGVVQVDGLSDVEIKLFSSRHLALASSAAPTFFPLVESEAVNGTLYADGGLYANNPSLVALVEALRVFVGPDSERKEFDTLSILSVGSFPSPVHFKVSWWREFPLFTEKFKQRLAVRWRSRPIRGWMFPAGGGAPPLVDVLMQVQGKNVEFILPILQIALKRHFQHYVRLDAMAIKPGRGAATNDLTEFSLADGRPKQIRKMKTLGENDGMTSASVSDVRHFFAAPAASVTLHPHPTQ
jgi:hypothetical protein